MDQAVRRVTQSRVVVVLIAREKGHITNAVKERNDIVSILHSESADLKAYLLVANLQLPSSADAD